MHLLKIRRRGRKRNRAIIVLLLPALISIWIVGWSLYWIGHRRESQELQPSSPKEEDYVSLIPAVPEDLLEIEN